MNVLVLGASSLARRRVLPALARAGATRVDVASRSRAEAAAPPEGVPGRVFDNYETAIAESGAELAYISTVNSLHAPLAERALARGLHVVVDKPAFADLDESRRLVELARARGRLLAEATVWGFHPQLDALRRVFDQAGSRPTQLHVTFSFPPLPPENFRYRAELGGGAIGDLGPYAITPGRLLFGAPPEKITCHVLDRRGEVETAFAVVALYPGGRSMVGQLGYTTGYRNSLDALGPDVTVSLARAFTSAPDEPAVLDATVRGRAQKISVEPADPFAIFLSRVFDSIARGDHGDHVDWSELVLADAAVLERLRSSAR